ncbi:hypothetical protein BJ944DRAFT_234188 [Cunninghamella echinulata]|nr:hypothetical protein BJ944DRAFT_234188 [Cunninghamella echinulata]
MTGKKVPIAPKYVRVVKFGCENCGRRWASANGSLTDYQLCKTCYTECYPTGHTIKPPNKRGNMNQETYAKHNPDLCGKCYRLGFSCMQLPDKEGEQEKIREQYIDQHGRTFQSEKAQLADFIDFDNINNKNNKSAKKKEKANYKKSNKK